MFTNRKKTGKIPWSMSQVGIAKWGVRLCTLRHRTWRGLYAHFSIHHQWIVLQCCRALTSQHSQEWLWHKYSPEKLWHIIYACVFEKIRHTLNTGSLKYRTNSPILETGTIEPAECWLLKDHRGMPCITEVWRGSERSRQQNKPPV
jgi:hypothetical protein